VYGEVDVDELMVISILRHCAPEGFEFLLKNMDPLRQESKDRNELSDGQKSLQSYWDQWTEKVEWDVQSALDLILFLVPNADRFLHGRKPWRGGLLPQSVSVSSPTDYWRRMVRGSLSEGDVPDQKVLEMIGVWRDSEGQSPVLAQYLYDHEKYIRVWEHLDESVQTPRLLELAGHLIEILLRQEGAHASADNQALIGIWRRSNRRLGRNIANAEWLAKNIKLAMPTSLELTVGLYYYWASRRHGIVEREGRISCRQKIVEVFKSHLDQNGVDGLIHILDNEHPFTLVHLVFPPDHDVEVPSVLRQPGDWQWLAPVLLTAAKIAPQRIVSQVACLVSKTRYTDPGEGPIYKYGLDLDHATGIFGEDLHQLMECLAAEIAVEDNSCAAVVASVQSEARVWLNSPARLPP